MHATLRFLGEAEPDVAIASLTRTSAQEPLSCVLGTRTDCFNNKVLYAPVNGLDELAASVVAATADIGNLSLIHI